MYMINKKIKWKQRKFNIVVGAVYCTISVTVYLNLSNSNLTCLRTQRKRKIFLMF